MRNISIVLLFLSLHLYGNNATVTTLIDLHNSQKILSKEIKKKNKALKLVKTEEEKRLIKKELHYFLEQKDTLKIQFNKIATGIDTSSIKKEKAQKTDIGDDIQLLIKPLIYEAKQATADMRKKAQLQEEIDHYKSSLQKAVTAHENIQNILSDNNISRIKKELKQLKKHWEQQISLLSHSLNASLYQMNKMEERSLSFSESFQESSKNFFQKRGRILFEGLIAFLTVITFLELIALGFVKIFPSTIKANRRFSLRLGALIFRFFMFILAIIAPMSIFYFEEDWVLFSFGLLVLLGLAWTFRYLLPNLWQEALLMLNIGSVREDERIYYQNLPWKVKHINIFTILENPASGVRLRLPIEELAQLTSRPSNKNEPWFPCRLNDWVVLSDDYYGKVVGVSLEFIEIVDIGGGHRVMLVSDFLALSPMNLSTNFRIINVLGISYKHQKEATKIIPDLLYRYIYEQLIKEGYENGLKKLLVQFSDMGDSSLNIKIIANFGGELAPIYYRLQRAINQWSVDACTLNGWEIPFPQLTVHQEEK